MKVFLDGQDLFGSEQLAIEQGSLSRGSIERTAAGLDGVLSIDLGSRARGIKQTGRLRAVSSRELDSKAEAIAACMDGMSHTLIADDGRQFDNIRVDSFKSKNKRAAGTGMVADYEIIYTQLAV